MNRLLTLLPVLSCLGCGAGPPADPMDAGEDGSSPMTSDSGEIAALDAGLDAGSADAGDASGAVDAWFPQPDAAEPEDAATCECSPTSECVTAMCVDGACLEAPVADGTTCGEMGMDLCVSGACIVRGCGDGWREPGTSPMREGCDDGNVLDGDTCSASCEPTPLMLYSDPAGLVDAKLTVQTPAIGVDGRGEVLVVYGRQSPDSGSIVADRLDPGGVPIGAAITIDPAVGAPITAEATVTGLAGGGWVVVWEAWRSGTRDVLYQMISPAGTAGAERVANAVVEGIQHEARVAPVGSGFVVVWTDATSTTDDPMGGIRARLFAASGAPVGGEMFVATERSQREDRPQVASSGTRWTVTWHRSMLTTVGSFRVLLRRFDGATPRDSGAMQAAPDGGRAAVIAALEDGNWALAWMVGSDIYARVVDDTMPALVDTSVMAVATMPSYTEERPVIAALGSGFVVGWEDGSPRAIAFAADPTTTLAPEAPMLAMELDMGGVPPVSIAPSPDGLWFAWTGYGFATPARALGVFHLPRD